MKQARLAKILCCSFLVVSVSLKSIAQVAINNTAAPPDASAMLDVSSANKGVLIPRVALQAANNASPVVSPANSLLVYNTATASSGNNAVTPGHYYWNTGTASWIRLNPELWKVNGDSIYTLYRNTGIGTASPRASAVLDVTSTNRGILIPRVALQAVNNASPVVSPANSLLVYNTATAGSGNNQVTPGHYYWDTVAVSWKRVSPELWKVSGDSIYTLYRNTGIGTASPKASAVLDVTSTNKGVLLPRVALVAANNAAPVVSPAHSLLVFNTATSGSGANAVTPGHYYWDTVTVSWKRVNALPPELWKVNGDSIYTLYRNTGIGTASPRASAVLDVTSTNRGILIPRVALQGVNTASPVASPANSLLVYNTATAGAGNNMVTPGHYFWDTVAVSWKRLSPELWKVNGDSIYTLYKNTGIGTASPKASAVLDVTSTNKGVLLPRVALLATNNAAPVVSPAHSLLVFNTATAGSGNNAVTPGHYYWDTVAVSWKRVNALPPELWKVNGDSIYTLYRNTGIGTASPKASAVLDVTSTNRGVLLPRVALQAANNAAPVVSPAHSLLVFNTATAGNGNNAVTPGHYFWDTTTVSWKRLNPELWKVNGDSIYTLYRNTGVGTASPNASAVLDVTSTNKGVLLPRVALQAANVATPVVSPAHTLLVYNTATAGAGNNMVTPGHYFWDTLTVSWKRLNPELWKVNGDSIYTLYRNTGIGTTSPNASAVLDVTSTNKGVLLPRVALQATNIAAPVVSPAHSLLVFNTATAGAGNNMVTPGHYFWDTSAISWVRLNAGAGSSELWKLSGDTIYTTYRNVGIGTSSPEKSAKLHIKTSDSTIGFLVSGTYDTTSVGTIPVLGAGSRMLYYPGPGIFRAGRVTGNAWDPVNAGRLSVAMGSNTIASGLGSTAFGNVTKAGNSFTTAMGDSSRAIGFASTAMGLKTTAKGFASTVVGLYNDSVLVADENAVTNLTPLFIVGNGSYSLRSNAMLVRKDGNVGLGTSAPQAQLHMNVTSPANGLLITQSIDEQVVTSVPNLGDGSRLMFYPGKSAFRAGTVTGTQWNDDNVGYVSFAGGYNNTAVGGASTAFGLENISAGAMSTALGYNNYTNGDASLATGQLTRSDGDYSTTTGDNTIAKSYAEFVIGKNNDTLLSTAPNRFTWNPDNALLVAGNGASTNSRHNAMVLYKNGNLVLKNPSAVTVDPLSYTTPVTGAGTRMMWLPQKSAFRAGTVNADQWDGANVGLHSFAAGNGTKAFGGSSFAIGNQSAAYGSSSFSSGISTITKSLAEFVIGQYNDTLLSTSPDPANWIGGNALFIAGNGTPGTRSNAMVVYKNGNTDHSGYTRLGEIANAAPTIKLKKLTGTSNVAADASVSVAHGLTATKIISINILMDGSPTLVSVPPSYTYTAGYEYQYHVTSTDIVVINTASNSANVLGKAFTILITYEE